MPILSYFKEIEVYILYFLFICAPKTFSLVMQILLNICTQLEDDADDVDSIDSDLSQIM